MKLNIEVLLVQFLILALTGLLWWIARRDLAARSVSPPAVPTAETAELEQLCATLETLVTRLSRRLDSVERQLAQETGRPDALPEPEKPARIEPARVEPARLEEGLARIAEGLARMEDRMEEGLAQRQDAPAPALSSAIPSTAVPASAASSSAVPSLGNGQAAEPAPDPRYLPVYALLNDGVTDPVEIARRTGLGRGEVELILSLRARRAF